jgi:hypothetical protein
MAVLLGGIGAASKEVYIFSIYPVIGISERDGLPIFGKTFQAKVTRTSTESAKEFMRKKYSYQATGKNYRIELDTIQPYKPKEKKK